MPQPTVTIDELFVMIGHLSACIAGAVALTGRRFRAIADILSA